MDFSNSEEEQAVAGLAREILEDHATNDRLKELESSGTPCDDKLWQALAESNLLGTAIPEAYGGSDLGFMPLCLLIQEVGRSVAPVPVFPALVLGALPLPVKYRIYFGRPMHFTGDPNDDETEIGAKVRDVKDAIASLLSQGLGERQGFFR